MPQAARLLGECRRVGAAEVGAEQQGFGERRAVVTLPSEFGRLGGPLGGAGDVAGVEGDVAGGDEGVGHPHRVVGLDRPTGRIGGGFRVVPVESVGQAVVGRHETLGVTLAGGDPDRLVEQGDRFTPLAAQELDEAEVVEWIEDAVGRQPGPDVVGPAEIGERQIELAEGEIRLTSIVVGERRERVGPGQFGSRDGEVELDDRLGVVPLFVEPAAPVGADPYDLGDVAGTFGMVEGDVVEAGVGEQVTVESGEHRPRRVGRCEGPVVAAGARPAPAPVRRSVRSRRRRRVPSR